MIFHIVKFILFSKTKAAKKVPKVPETLLKKRKQADETRQRRIKSFLEQKKVIGYKQGFKSETC